VYVCLWGRGAWWPFKALPLPGDATTPTYFFSLLSQRKNEAYNISIYLEHHAEI
jgi:hypothetical protein